MDDLACSLAILVIDDEPAVVGAIAQVLRAAEHSVTTATSGRAAVALLKEQPFDIVITDVLMPDVDGIEIIVSVRKLQPRAKILAMSGGGHRMDLWDARRVTRMLGVAACLEKPFTPLELLALLGAVIEGKSRGSDEVCQLEPS